MARFCVALSMLEMPMGGSPDACSAVVAPRIVAVAGRDNARRRPNPGRRAPIPPSPLGIAFRAFGTAVLRARRPSFGHSPRQTLRRRQLEPHRDLEKGARIREGIADVPDGGHDEWNHGELRWHRFNGRAKSRGQRSSRCPDRVGLAGVCVTLVAATMRSITRSPNGRCAAMGRHRHVETRSNLNESAFGLITGIRKHIFQEAVQM